MVDALLTNDNKNYDENPKLSIDELKLLDDNTVLDYFKFLTALKAAIQPYLSLYFSGYFNLDEEQQNTLLFAASSIHICRYVISNEVLERIIKNNKVDLSNQNPLYSSPFLYPLYAYGKRAGFECENIFLQLKDDAEKTCLDINHPDDYVWDEKINRIRKERGVKEGFISEYLLDTIHKHFGDITEENILDTMYIWREDLAKLPRRIHDRLLNEGKTLRRIHRNYQIYQEPLNKELYKDRAQEDNVKRRENNLIIRSKLRREKDNLPPQAFRKRTVLEFMDEKLGLSEDDGFDFSPKEMAKATGIGERTISYIYKDIAKSIPELKNLLK